MMEMDQRGQDPHKRQLGGSLPQPSKAKVYSQCLKEGSGNGKGKKEEKKPAVIFSEVHL